MPFFSKNSVNSALVNTDPLSVTIFSGMPCTAEKNYSQLEKEGLAIVYGVKKFHTYLCGRHFTIYSDHQPLRRLFNESKGIPAMAASRIQRWALTLSAYEYSIAYRPGKEHANADALSRLPLPQQTDMPVPGDLLLLQDHLDTMSLVTTE